MCKPFPPIHKDIADSMGIALYQRFSLNEASLFLRCPTSEVEKLIASGGLGYITVTDSNLLFFGYQLLDYLLNNVTEGNVPKVPKETGVDRIIRVPELVKMTGLSRTTIWRYEKKGDFPMRVSLGVGSVGWRYSEVKQWMDARERIS